MKKVNDVTGWLSQTTDVSKYFVWSPGLRHKESRLYCEFKLSIYWLWLYCGMWGGSDFVFKTQWTMGINEKKVMVGEIRKK